MVILDFPRFCHLRLSLFLVFLIGSLLLGWSLWLFLDFRLVGLVFDRFRSCLCLVHRVLSFAFKFRQSIAPTIDVLMWRYIWYYLLIWYSLWSWLLIDWSFISILSLWILLVLCSLHSWFHSSFLFSLASFIILLLPFLLASSIIVPAFICLNSFTLYLILTFCYYAYSYLCWYDPLVIMICSIPFLSFLFLCYWPFIVLFFYIIHSYFFLIYYFLGYHLFIIASSWSLFDYWFLIRLLTLLLY